MNQGGGGAGEGKLGDEVTGSEMKLYAGKAVRGGDVKEKENWGEKK